MQQDLSELRRVEAALAAQVGLAHARLAELEAIYATAPVGLCVLDRELRYVRINQRLAEFNGLPVAEHIGRTVFEVVPDVAAKVEPRFRRILETGNPSLSAELTARTAAQPDVERSWLEHGVPVRGIGGEIIGLSLVVEETTEQKRTEEVLRSLQRLNAVGRLAGGIAHEANNQMTVVLGSASFLLERRNLPADVREELEQIRRAAERTASLTQQLLAFSRRQLWRPESLDLNRVVKEFEPILAGILGDKCHVVLQLSPGEALVLTDPDQLEQMLLQLAFNARDAMPLGGLLRIEITTAELPADFAVQRGVVVQPGCYVVLAVSDTGHGMDSETLQHLFEPFFTTKPVGQGTGLGLSTVYGIVKQSGGYIWTESEQGRGAIFRIYLPAVGSQLGRLEPDHRQTSLHQLGNAPPACVSS